MCMLHTLVVLCDLPRVHMSFGVLYLLVTVTLMSVWTSLNYRSLYPSYLWRSPGGGHGILCLIFKSLPSCIISFIHVRTFRESCWEKEISRRCNSCEVGILLSQVLFRVRLVKLLVTTVTEVSPSRFVVCRRSGDRRAAI